MKNIIFLFVFVALLFSCQPPAKIEGAEANKSKDRYQMEIVNDPAIGGVIIYVLDKTTGKVVVRTSDGAWRDISGEGIKSAKPL